jgi:DNA adenine methylase
MAKSPIKFVGGKSKLAPLIISMFPFHTCYVEVFGGAGHVLFAKPPSPVEVFNDKDGDLVNFFRVVKHRHEELIRAFDWVLVSRQLFDEYKAQDPVELDDLQRATRFFYLINRSFGGKYSSPVFQTSKTHDFPGGHVKYVEAIITQAYERLLDVAIERGDFEEIIGRYDGPETLFFCDPPYLGNCDQYPHNDLAGAEEQERLARCLLSIEGKFLLTIGDHPLIRELYAGCHAVEVDVVYSMSRQRKGRGAKPELIVANYDLDGASGPLFSRQGQGSLFASGVCFVVGDTSGGGMGDSRGRPGLSTHPALLRRRTMPAALD